MRSGDLEWRKSSRSQAPNNECVEICFAQDEVLVRDSKNPDGPVLRVTAAAWTALVEMICRNGVQR
jgi:hypothetical protein